MISWPWLALFLLGAYHGVNPGMGWLFAVALGLQEKSKQAVFRSLLPLGLGHVISVALVTVTVQLARVSLPQPGLRMAMAAILASFGLYRLIRSRHPKWVGMRVDSRDLALWSFLMSSAHGAGLMLAPILLGFPGPVGQEHRHSVLQFSAMQSLGALGSMTCLLPVAVHTLGYLVVTGGVAFLVYEKLGVAVLRRAWVNLDLLWAIALTGMGLLTLFL